MPNQRAENQKLLPVAADADFIAELDKNLGACGYSNRSQFVRDAIIEKLMACGIAIPKKLALSPDRQGKGGAQKTQQYVAGAKGSTILNDPNSSSNIARRAVLKRVADSIRKSDPK